MATKNKIGLDTNKVNKIVEKLNVLLADFSIFYMNVRGFHWNIQGDGFFVLHEKFEEIYDDLADKIDELAERILTLGQTPVHAYSEYIKLSGIEEMKNISNGRDTVAHVLEVFQKLIASERELIELAGEADDEGTTALMSDYIREQEKTIWMLNAWMQR